jgi:predicted RNase H-like HicB family nuclease
MDDSHKAVQAPGEKGAARRSRIPKGISPWELIKDRKPDFGVSFPDFPGCGTAGKTPGEARNMAVEALSLHLEGTIEDGEAIPDASTLHDPAMKGAVAPLVNVNAAEKAGRFNITARRSQMEEIDRRSRPMVSSALARAKESQPARRGR